MEKKRVITFYNDKSEPYFQAMLDGMKESPAQRFVTFFENKTKMDEFLGLVKPKGAPRTLTIKKPEWI
ncbi:MULTISPECIES: hypothetical protein [Dyadobacter]|uniref:Uncharacterized protein n=1 Tax=Dyadobacter chenhuakuii TaxID=2909339 RepID=A0ABY4XJ17_9BACT|nr:MULTISPECIES: hypothetical protein [Dyadobacter]MCE7071803.1 hypothetical protein [Dyadobacter sp. CY327]MCF2496367.1 hypothetical protein [Dyadobacter chenhuakuii]MCF2519468.1 hypothetical protein [Dyadobacter sp. CY351]USJ30427.1 hypothetical protein NFI80_21515 [Dyadobacter chenhuakuii]